MTSHQIRLAKKWFCSIGLGGDKGSFNNYKKNSAFFYWTFEGLLRPSLNPTGSPFSWTPDNIDTGCPLIFIAAFQWQRELFHQTNTGGLLL